METRTIKSSSDNSRTIFLSCISFTASRFYKLLDSNIGVGRYNYRSISLAILWLVIRARSNIN